MTRCVEAGYTVDSTEVIRVDARAEEAATGPRLIKRYANRKLYDTRDSRYVTLQQIAEFVRRGDDVQIIDNKSKEDLTNVTLAQIIYEEEKKGGEGKRLPLASHPRQIGCQSCWKEAAARLEEALLHCAAVRATNRLGRLVRRTLPRRWQ